LKYKNYIFCFIFLVFGYRTWTIEEIRFTTPELKSKTYEVNDLVLNLILSGSGNIKNTENTFISCNKIIIFSKISGSGKIKIFKIEKGQLNLVPLSNKKTENFDQKISGSGNMTIDTKSRFYDTIECNASISGSGNIHLYVSYDEIEWRKKEVSGSGKILMINSDNGIFYLFKYFIPTGTIISAIALLHYYTKFNLSEFISKFINFLK